MKKTVRLGDVASEICGILDECGEVSFVYDGRDMLPIIRSGRDLVTVMSPETDIKINDVLLYRRENGDFVLGRVIYINDGLYVMRGDDRSINEYNIKSEQIIGKMISFDRNSKTCTVTDKGYKIYVAFLPIVFFFRKIGVIAKSRIIKFIKFLFRR